MAIFEVINIGSAPNANDGDDARTWAQKSRDNFAKSANIQEENIFLKKQTIKAATEDGSKALIIKDLSDVEVGYFTDEGKMVLIDDIEAKGISAETIEGTTSVKAASFLAADDSPGLTGTLTWRDADTSSDLTLHFKQGIITQIDDPR